jgi:hypothetical protein
VIQVQKRSHRLALSRLSKVAVIIKKVFRIIMDASQARGTC